MYDELCNKNSIKLLLYFPAAAGCDFCERPPAVTPHVTPDFNRGILLARTSRSAADGRGEVGLARRRRRAAFARRDLAAVDLLVRAPHLELGGILLLSRQELRQRSEGAAKVSTSWRISSVCAGGG